MQINLVAVTDCINFDGNTSAIIIAPADNEQTNENCTNFKVEIGLNHDRLSICLGLRQVSASSVDSCTYLSTYTINTSISSLAFLSSF